MRPTPRAPEVDSFSKDFAQLRQALIQLQRKIDETTTTITRNTDSTYARQQADELKEAIDKLLASVADNGPLAVAGPLAASYARARYAAIQQDQRFTFAQREPLARQ
jgi:hypothetical protein